MPCEPGTVCPECDRRVPHPKKTDSPRSVVYSMRIPTIDELAVYRDITGAAQEHASVAGQPFAPWKTSILAHSLLLQDALGDWR